MSTCTNYICPYCSNIIDEDGACCDEVNHAIKCGSRGDLCPDCSDELAKRESCEDFLADKGDYLYDCAKDGAL